jgi:hypothetical protein
MKKNKLLIIHGETMIELSTVYKDGRDNWYLPVKSLHEGASIQELSILLGKGKATITRHFKSEFPFNAVPRGKALSLSIDEQIAVIQSFPKHFVVRGMKKTDDKHLTENCSHLTENGEAERSPIQPPLPPAERVQIFSKLLEFFKREEQEKQERNAQLVDLFLRLSGIPTPSEERMGYLITELAFENVELGNDPELKKLSLVYRENRDRDIRNSTV